MEAFEARLRDGTARIVVASNDLYLCVTVDACLVALGLD